MGPNCFVSPGGPSPTVANRSEGPANWAPGAGGLDERVPITLVHESLVMLLRDQLGGFQDIDGATAGPRKRPDITDLLYLIVMFSVVGALSPYRLCCVTFTRGLEANGRLAVVGVMPPSQRCPPPPKGSHFADHERLSLAFKSTSPSAAVWALPEKQARRHKSAITKPSIVASRFSSAQSHLLCPPSPQIYQ